jgi:hypothetical protein
VSRDLSAVSLKWIAPVFRLISMWTSGVMTSILPSASRAVNAVVAQAESGSDGLLRSGIPGL